MKGFADAGMGAVGKHFPGHGYAEADSHVAVPKDDRKFTEIAKKDLVPFRATIEAGLAAVMPAHVIYSQVDQEPAGYSKHWLQEVLRASSASRGSSSATTFPWKARASPAASPNALAPRSPRDATWCFCAMIPRARSCPGFLEDVPPANLDRVERMRKKGGRDLRKSVACRDSQELLKNLA